MPLGWLRIAGDEAAVHAIAFEEEEGLDSPDPPATLLQCREELNEYFRGSARRSRSPGLPKEHRFNNRSGRPGRDPVRTYPFPMVIWLVNLAMRMPSGPWVWPMGKTRWPFSFPVIG